MNLVIKGFIIGLGKIIPGVSGSMLAISLGIYEDIIENISKIKTNFKESIKYLIKPSIGIIFAIILGSKIIVKCLNKFYFPTMLLFIGMLVGGIPNLIKNAKIKKMDLLKISIILTPIFLIINNIPLIKNHEINYTIIEFIKLIGIGVSDAASSIIPGISGTAILMTLGYYNVILETFGTILKINKIPKNIFIIIPFFMGFIIGTIIISKILNKIIKEKKESMYLIITIFMIITLIQLSKNLLISSQSMKTYLIGIVFFILGINVSIRIKTI